SEAELKETQDPGTHSVPGAPVFQENKKQEGFLAAQTPLGMTGSGQGGAPATQAKRTQDPGTHSVPGTPVTEDQKTQDPPSQNEGGAPAGRVDSSQSTV